MNPDNRTDYLIARALCTAAGADETTDAHGMLELLIDRYPDLAQRVLHEFKTGRPAPHLRVLF
jgi:hypothetical protein